MNRLTVMTYNVRSCRGSDGKAQPARIARLIAQHKPDVVGLQELDADRPRTDFVDQAAAIARHLDMEPHFHATLHLAHGRYGNAILTRTPNRLVRADHLPSRGEQRGAIWLTLQLADREVHVINTHLGLLRGDRHRQLSALLGSGWAGHPAAAEAPMIVMGDFNASPSSRIYAMMAGFGDALSQGAMKARATFPARFAFRRIDYIFQRGLTTIGARVVDDPLARRASDHLPVLAVFSVPPHSPAGGVADAARDSA